MGWPGKGQPHTQACTQTQHINISANCPLLTGQPPPYLGLSRLGYRWRTAEPIHWIKRSRIDSLEQYSRSSSLQTLRLKDPSKVCTQLIRSAGLVWKLVFWCEEDAETEIKPKSCPQVRHTTSTFHTWPTTRDRWAQPRDPALGGLDIANTHSLRGAGCCGRWKRGCPKPQTVPSNGPSHPPPASA